MSTRHVKPPTPLFLFFLPVPRFSCSTAPQGFSRPDRVLSQAGARRVCQGWPLFSGHRQGSAFTRPSTTAGLMGRVDYTPISYLARLRVGGGVIVFRSRMLFSAGLATKSMARAIIASTYIRQLRSGLPRCCLHGRSRRWMGLIFGTAYWQVPICDVGQQPRIRPARHTRLGCRNSARYRVRAAPCGTRPCSR